MSARMQIANPDAVEVTLTMTMTLGDWKALREQIGRQYPAWKLNIEIGSMVARMASHIMPEPEAES